MIGKTEEALLKSEEKYRTLFNSIDQGFLLGEVIRNNEGKGIDYFVHEVNATYEEQTGISIEKVLGKTVLQSFPTIDKWWIETYTSVVDTQYPVRFEKFFEFTNRWFEIKATPAGGEMFIILFTDITDRILTVEKIKESEERFRSIADDAPVFIFLAGENAEVEYLNKTWRDYTGISTKQSKGQGWAEITHPDDIEFSMKIYTDSFNNRVSCSFENRQKGIDGIYRAILWKATPRFSVNGQFLGMMGVGFDIHEQKLASAKIERSERQFSTLANNIHNLAWIADDHGYIYWYNQQWYDYTGTTLDEMKGWGWEKVQHPEHLNRVVDFVKQAWHINEPFELTFPLRRHDGEYRWFLTRANPITDEAGKIINWIGTNTDITEQRTFAAQLKEKVDERTAELNCKNDELEKLNKELESFNYISSHDLQEPLRQIQNFASRINDIEQQNLSPNGKIYFEKINNAAKRMQTLIADLLAYSRTKTQERKFEITDLNIIVEQVKKELQEVMDEKNATIEVGEMCSAKIIPFQFLQLMHNLISNALKFSKPEIPAHIIIKSHILKGSNLSNEKLLGELNYCHIQVTDNGIGFEPQYKDRIFEVFQRLHDRQKIAGTGIGLAIVKKIVENHNGIITATSQLNEGATFDIFIPTI